MEGENEELDETIEGENEKLDEAKEGEGKRRILGEAMESEDGSPAIFSPSS